MPAAASRPRDLDTLHMPALPRTLSEWKARRTALRAQILRSAGLWPMPVRGPLKPVVTGRSDGPDYTVENVAIETLPGFYLCGNLYRPKGRRGPFPGIANPHGHWPNGRLELQSDVARAEPAPAPPGDGRGNLVAIGVNLARMGFVVFAYDMCGYNDTNQVGHGYAGSLEHWQWGVSLLGLQLWNSLRVVDYLQSLPDVDRGRIGATGASGGGTQTFLLAAIDDRVKVSVPVNMVSASMQGGCLCENGPGLRVGTDNVEIAALCAPRPQLLVCCTADWTQNVPEREWPAVRHVYGLHGAEDRTAAVRFNYQHNYNIESREAMYAWFGRWLAGDSDPGHFRERPFEADTAAMRVWTAVRPRPGGLDEAGVTRHLEAGAEASLRRALEAGRAALTRTYRPALAQALGVAPAAGRRRSAERSPAALVVCTPDGASRAEALRAAIGHGAEVVTMDAIPPNAAQTAWAAYFSTYNRTLLGDRVAHIVTALRRGGGRVRLVGVGEAGPWCLFARAVSDVAGDTVADADRFDAGDNAAWAARLYAPGLRRAGDIRSATALAAIAGRVWVHNTRGRWRLTDVTDAAARWGGVIEAADAEAASERVAAWLAAP